MKRLISFLFFITAMTVAISPAFANHETIPILKDKFPIMQTVCDKDGKQGKGEEGDKGCYLFVADPASAGAGTKYWVALYNESEADIFIVFERTVGSEDIITVWKKGWRGV